MNKVKKIPQTPLDQKLQAMTKEQKRKYNLIKHWRKILFFVTFLISLFNPTKVLISIFTAVLFFNVSCIIGKLIYKLDMYNMTKLMATVELSKPDAEPASVVDPARSTSQSAASDNIDLTKAMEALSILYNKKITEKDIESGIEPEEKEN